MSMTFKRDALFGWFERKVVDQRFNWRIVHDADKHYKLPEGYFVIEASRTGARLVIVPSGKTRKLSTGVTAPAMALFHAFQVGTIIEDGAIWGVKGTPCEEMIWTRTDNLI